jgi:hypothetical protein
MEEEFIWQTWHGNPTESEIKWYGNLTKAQRERARTAQRRLDSPEERARATKIMESARTAKTLQELIDMNLYKSTEEHSDDYSELYDKLYQEDYERRKKESEHIEKYGNIGTKNHYKIVKGTNLNELEKNVNEYLEKGYNVSGGILFEKEKTKNDGISRWVEPSFYLQAVFRKGIEIELSC